jgi:hypothetical protein
MYEISENVYVSNWYDAKTQTSQKEFDAVVSVGEKKVPETTHTARICNGLNGQLSFDEATKTVQRVLEENESVIIHGRSGKSRCVVLATLALSDGEYTAFEDLISETCENYSAADPKEILLLHAEDYLGKNTLKEYCSQRNIPLESVYTMSGGYVRHPDESGTA